MSIDIKTISQLRDQTGAGIGDCKKALEEADGVIEKAIEILRKKGEIKATKKADRTAKEGVVALAQEGNKIAAVVINCETDFVAINEDFINTVQGFAQKLLTENNKEAFRSWAEETIKNELVIKIGENIQLGNFGTISGEVVGSYLHSNRKVAGVVALSGGDAELAKDIAMQIVAMTPKYLNPETIPAEVLEKEKEIYREQLKAEGKPEAIWDKIITGKLSKFYEDNCLVNQKFIKDEEKNIKDILGENQIIEFTRFQV